ncbi:serine hydrolase domain-containing protein [Pseudoduganella sp. GCM10020061]|uniref:serine hydrolase domain-containing protein n=1 Tax=Pseudoduganella sp. GCM10020061 TaxID=3317345 RepID=UPI00363DACB5
MQQGRRALLGLALLGGVSRVMSAHAMPQSGGALSALRDPDHGRLDAELAAIFSDPACQLASMSVIAVRHGKPVYQRQLGHRVIDGDASQPVTARTMFRIASISKFMTTLGLMRLVEEGRVTLDADVSTWLGFSLRNPHFPDQPITLRHLLTHNASLRDDAGYAWPADRALKDILVPGAPHYGDGKMWSPRAPAGAYFTYCNLNWAVIGTLMERVTGERFDRLMKRLLLDPLGLRGGYNPSEMGAEDVANIATLYRKRTTDTEVWDPNGPWIAQVDDFGKKAPAPPPGIGNYAVGTNATPFSPTGGLRISAAGLSTVMLMLMNRGRHEGRQFLKPETVLSMLTRQWTFDGRGENGDSNRNLFYAWGLGNQHYTDQPLTGHQVVEGGGFSGIGHFGYAYGLRSAFVMDPASGNGMIMLVGGSSTEPELQPGRYSSMPRMQERILTALYRHAIAA